MIIDQKKNVLYANCSNDDFFNHWYDYFALGEDYDIIYSKAKNLPNVISLHARKNDGLRILHPNCQESFIYCIAFRNSIGMNGFDPAYQAKRIINGLYFNFGEKRRNSTVRLGELVWNTFPTSQQVLAEDSFNDFADKDIRYNHIREAYRDLLEGWYDFEWLGTLGYESAKQFLVCFDYIDDVLANMICLYVLRYNESCIKDKNTVATFSKNGIMSIDDFFARHKDIAGGFEGILENYVVNAQERTNDLGYLRGH